MSIPTLADARARDTNLLRRRYRVGDPDYARARDTNLLRARYRVSDLNYARDLDYARDRALARARGLCEARRVLPSAAGLLTAAARLLPAADRARYGEEYRAELWDLARSGAGRLPQLGYALRQLRAALPAGFALRSPRRGSAAR